MNFFNYFFLALRRYKKIMPSTRGDWRHTDIDVHCDMVILCPPDRSWTTSCRAHRRPRRGRWDARKPPAASLPCPAPPPQPVVRFAADAKYPTPVSQPSSVLQIASSGRGHHLDVGVFSAGIEHHREAASVVTQQPRLAAVSTARALPPHDLTEPCPRFGFSSTWR